MMTRRSEHLENKIPTWKIPKLSTSVSKEYSLNHILEVRQKTVLL